VKGSPWWYRLHQDPSLWQEHRCRQLDIPRIYLGPRGTDGSGIQEGTGLSWFTKFKEEADMREQFGTIDEYIASFPGEVRAILETLRQTIQKAAPDATEAIAYGIPTFRLHGNLVHFAAFRNHISFFPTSSGIAAFRKELSPYKTAKGTVQFPLGKPVPYDLVEKITAFRVTENNQKKSWTTRPGRF
jgi:uncharacterized protein YdhG (YjbR/CyaY superfamily)